MMCRYEFQRLNSFKPCSPDGIGMALGLELLDKVFFGVPGGVLGGVAPFPLTLLSPK